MSVTSAGWRQFARDCTGEQCPPVTGGADDQGVVAGNENSDGGELQRAVQTTMACVRLIGNAEGQKMQTDFSGLLAF